MTVIKNTQSENSENMHDATVILYIFLPPFRFSNKYFFRVFIHYSDFKFRNILILSIILQFLIVQSWGCY